MLGHRLDHEVALGEVGEVGGEANPVMQLASALPGQLAAVRAPVGRVLQAPAALLDSLGGHLDRDDVKAVAGEHLHDARTHGAESDHANCCEITSHAVESARRMGWTFAVRPRRLGRLPAVRLVIARCSVDYEGRLQAHLPLATRLLMVKADGSVLVHSDGGSYKPLNWMSPPCAMAEIAPEEHESPTARVGLGG